MVSEIDLITIKFLKFRCKVKRLPETDYFTMPS